MNNRKNSEITAPIVRVIFQNENKGTMKLTDALDLAKSLGLDLVEISSQKNESICKIVDWGKYQYENSKKVKKTHTKQHEVRIRINIDPHDLEIKANNIQKFIDKGDKVKIVILFKGRQTAYMDMGYKLIENLKELISKAKYTSIVKSGNNLNFVAEKKDKN